MALRNAVQSIVAAGSALPGPQATCCPWPVAHSSSWELQEGCAKRRGGAPQARELLSNRIIYLRNQTPDFAEWCQLVRSVSLI